MLENLTESAPSVKTYFTFLLNNLKNTRKLTIKADKSRYKYFFSDEKLMTHEYGKDDSFGKTETGKAPDVAALAGM